MILSTTVEIALTHLQDCWGKKCEVEKLGKHTGTR